MIEINGIAHISLSATAFESLVTSTTRFVLSWE